MPRNQPALTAKRIARYARYLCEQERTAQTVQKYTRALYALMQWLGSRPLTKRALLEWKEELTCTHAATSVNATVAAINGYLNFWKWGSMRLRPLRLQRALFYSEDKELTKNEYARLVNAAKWQGNQRLSLVIQTICATGIRVSELKFITVETVKQGRIDIFNKGKQRTIFLPHKLQCLLRKYLKKQKITAGAVFVSRNGKPLDRSNIWRDMKALCKVAGVASAKVFPHNLRHLFARTYYTMEKDLSRLADILGHSNINTTRIYTAESGHIHARKIERLGLIVT